MNERGRRCPDEIIGGLESLGGWILKKNRGDNEGGAVIELPQYHQTDLKQPRGMSRGKRTTSFYRLFNENYPHP